LNRNTIYSNEELIAGLVAKDNSVLQYIINTNKKAVQKLVVKNNGSQADADDVLQETIIVLFRKVQENNFKLTSTLNTFIYSIARLIWLKELEKRKANETIAEEPVYVIDDTANIHAIINKNDRLRLYREKFEELGEDCKKVLRLFYLGTPMTQITKLMEYGSVDYTKRKKYKCKNALIDKIKATKQFKELGYGNTK
jgi:RNA polymerase sigma factor (sigma-70 family)